MSGDSDLSLRTNDRAIDPAAPPGVGAENQFAGVLSLFRRRYAKAVAGASPAIDVVAMGLPFDSAVSNRPGTRFGPRAVRAASTNVTWDGGPWRWPFDPFERINMVDGGDFEFDPGDLASFNESIQVQARAVIDAGPKLLTIGGDHFVSYPLIKAHAEKYGPLALIQFDAHSDTWRDWTPQSGARRIDHGTMFFHALQDGLIDAKRSVQLGIRSGNPETHGVTVLDADWVHDHTPGEAAARIRDIVGSGPAYLSFDIDCLDPAFAPGTGTPVCGGLSSAQAERVLCGLGGVDIVGADLVEVAPSYDVSEITALAGATMLLNIVAHWAAARGE